MTIKERAYGIYKRFVQPFVVRNFYRDLVLTSNNFGRTTWLGNPIWQNTLDLWTIQETLSEVRPALLIECGTNRGGSAIYYSHLFDLMGKGKVISIDVERLHDLSHPRATFLIGSSTSPEILEIVRDEVSKADGPIMVILDSDHSEEHVYNELQAYAKFVTPNSYCLVQDGVIDVLPVFRDGRPGPLKAIKRFMREQSHFVIDRERCDRFIITHHPDGWLRRIA